MSEIGNAIAQSPIAQTLLANPVMAIAIVLIAFGIAKALKLAGKVVKMILCLGLAYILVNFFMSGVV